ncbi:MAG: Tol-Pal system beta propeller repeat protein TolB [Deltaproteobacteria bacterium]|nr:Tol-Pal system beta propeller repeat protein TolB [Deltaproteobacteria bacterium]
MHTPLPQRRVLRMHMRCAAVFITACLIVSHPGTSACAKVYIDINAPSATRVPIIIPPFQNTGSEPDTHKLSTGMASIISADLEFSGLFQIIDPKLLNEAHLRGVTRNEINWDSLSVVGAEAIVTGVFAISGNRINIEMRLFDAVQGRFIMGKKYSGTVPEYRRISHRFANEVFKELTGAPGMFETGIVFVMQTGGNKELYYCDYDGGNQRRLTTLNSLALSPCVSPDGSRVAFTSYRDGNPDLYVMNLAGGRIEKISSKKGINISPDFSPDGGKIALTLSPKDGNSEIFALDVQRRTLERITDHRATDVSPSWSPDGRQMAFVSSRSGNPQIFINTLADRSVRRVTFGRGNYNTSPAWSPRGDRIAYAGLIDGRFNIHTIAPDGSRYRQLTAGQGNNEDPSWSPDGRYITFSSNRTGRKEIYIMRADGTGQKKITVGSGDKTDPAWAPLPGN